MARLGTAKIPDSTSELTYLLPRTSKCYLAHMMRGGDDVLPCKGLNFPESNTANMQCNAMRQTCQCNALDSTRLKRNQAGSRCGFVLHFSETSVAYETLSRWIRCGPLTRKCGFGSSLNRKDLETGAGRARRRASHPAYCKTCHADIEEQVKYSRVQGRGRNWGQVLGTRCPAVSGSCRPVSLWSFL